MLERGDYVPREKENWDSRAVNVDAQYNTKELWRDKDGKALHPHTNYYVGGNTKFYGAALFRLRKQDFGEFGITAAFRPPGRSTTTSSSRTTPRPNTSIRCTAQRGEDPTEPAASAPIRFPAVSHEPRIQQLDDDFTRLGLRPFHVPLGIRLDEKNPHNSQVHPLRHVRRLSVPRPREGRRAGDLRRSGARPSQRHAADQRVRHAAGDERVRPRVTGVQRATRNGAAEELLGRRRGVSCGAVNSAALLLRSANDSIPNGLANCSDVVGRHYMGHINSVLMAVSKCPNPTVFQKTLGGQRLLLRLEGLNTRWAISRSSASSTPRRCPPARRRSRRDSRST